MSKEFIKAAVTRLKATASDLPLGMPNGDNSDHNVNEVVQPTITVQAMSKEFIKAAVERLKATETEIL